MSEVNKIDGAVLYITAQLQIYLLSKTTIVPEKFKKHEFLKLMITRYLNLCINHLSVEQKNRLYEIVLLKLRKFKEYHPNQKSIQEFKQWLHKSVQQEIRKIGKQSKGESLNLENEVDCMLIDEINKETNSNDNKDGESNKNKSTKNVAVETPEQKKTEDKEKCVKKNTTINWSDFKIPKKTNLVASSNVENKEKGDETIISTKPDESLKKSGVKKISQRRQTLGSTNIRSTVSMDSRSEITAFDKILSPTDVNKARGTSVPKARARRMTVDERICMTPIDSDMPLKRKRSQKTDQPGPKCRKRDSLSEIEAPNIATLSELPKDIGLNQTTLDKSNKAPLVIDENSKSSPDPKTQTVVAVQKSPETHQNKRKPGPKRRQRTLSSTSGISLSEIESSDNVRSDTEIHSIIKIENSEMSFVTNKAKTVDVSKFFDEKSAKDNCLSVDGAKVCDYYYELDPVTKMITLSKGSPVETESRGVFELKELLYWPGVGVEIKLPKLTIQRYCNPNVQWELTSKSDAPENDLKPNKEVIYRYYGNKKEKYLATLEKDVELNHDLVRTYLEVMIKCLSTTNYVKQKEIELIFRTLLSDVNTISRSFENVAYSYHLNDYKYHRIFEQDVELSSNVKLLSLREVYNPEIVFKITRCDFKELGKIDFHELMNYFKTILVEQDADAMEEFNTMLGEGYTLFCVSCQKQKLASGQFNNAKRVAEISKHVGPYCVNDFKCVKCGHQSNILDLVKLKWCHNCENH